MLSTAIVVSGPAFSDVERIALGGYLAGYSGLAREASALNLRQFAAWCEKHNLRLWRRGALTSSASTATSIRDRLPACATNIEDLGIERGHRLLRMVGKANTPATIPLVPRTARTVDLAVGERCSGPILRRCERQCLDRQTAHGWVRSISKRAEIGPVHPHMLRAAFIMGALDTGVPL